MEEGGHRVTGVTSRQAGRQEGHENTTPLMDLVNWFTRLLLVHLGSGTLKKVATWHGRKLDSFLGPLTTTHQCPTKQQQTLALCHNFSGRSMDLNACFSKD